MQQRSHSTLAVAGATGDAASSRNTTKKGIVWRNAATQHLEGPWRSALCLQQKDRKNMFEKMQQHSHSTLAVGVPSASSSKTEKTCLKKCSNTVTAPWRSVCPLPPAARQKKHVWKNAATQSQHLGGRWCHWWRRLQQKHNQKRNCLKKCGNTAPWRPVA